MGNETRWTKGPWAVKALKNGIEHEIKRDGYFVATVHGSCVGEAKIGSNAHLIAAAPELYEHLAYVEQMLTAHENGEELPGDDDAIRWGERARATLAKARGEQS